MQKKKKAKRNTSLTYDFPRLRRRQENANHSLKKVESDAMKENG